MLLGVQRQFSTCLKGFKMLIGSLFCVFWSPELGSNMAEAEKGSFDISPIVLHLQEGELLV